ncbi:hypothetical protein DENSPDRAFT_573845 [Dentipellis sp. KUC8613]|nr:hypothetical protein DENSPDRAFT_573845 [Dentipellis sp. KUC8613]
MPSETVLDARQAYFLELFKRTLAVFDALLVEIPKVDIHTEKIANLQHQTSLMVREFQKFLSVVSRNDLSHLGDNAGAVLFIENTLRSIMSLHEHVLEWIRKDPPKPVVTHAVTPLDLMTRYSWGICRYQSVYTGARVLTTPGTLHERFVRMLYGALLNWDADPLNRPLSKRIDIFQYMQTADEPDSNMGSMRYPGITGYGGMGNERLQQLRNEAQLAGPQPVGGARSQV